MLAFLRRLARRLLDPPPPPIPDLDPDDPACDSLAADLIAMGPHAAPRDGRPSPGTERLLARARLLGQQRFALLVGGLSHGIATSSASRLAIGGAEEDVTRAAADEERAHARLDEHAGRRPRRPPVANRVSAHPACRVLIAALCACIELLVTAPALAILTHGRRLLGLLPLEDALAALLGLMTFVAAEVAAECFLTWRRGRPSGRPTLAARLVAAVRSLAARVAGRSAPAPGRRPGTGRPATPDARAALVAGIVIVVAMLGALGWLLAVRDANVRAAHEIAAGAGTSANLGFGGLPGAPVASGGPISGLGSGAAAGPISGLGGGAAPVAIGAPAASSAPSQPEGHLGPIGALSIIVFLVALTSATLAGTTEDYAAWSRKRRALRSEHHDARHRRTVAERARAAATTRAPLGSVAYDAAARHAITVADAYLQLVTAWEGLVRQRYAVHCRRSGTEPVVLGFPPLPALPDEVERLLTPAVPDGRQAGGFAFGTEAPGPEGAGPVHGGPEQGAPGAAGPTSGETETPPAEDAPGTPGPDSGGGEEADTAGPAGRPGSDAVLDAVADLVARLRGSPEEPPAPRRRGGRFVRGLRRRVRRDSAASDPAHDPDPAA